MNREDIVAVACRLCALYLIFTSIASIPAVVQMSFLDQDTRHFAPFGVAIIAAQLAVAAVLWLFPLTVAKKLLPVMREARSGETLDGAIVLSVGITLIGLWFLTNGTISLIYWLTFYLQSRSGDGLDDVTPGQLAEIWASVAQVTIALAFLIGTKGIKRLIFWMRYG